MQISKLLILETNIVSYVTRIYLHAVMSDTSIRPGPFERTKVL